MCAQQHQTNDICRLLHGTAVSFSFPIWLLCTDNKPSALPVAHCSLHFDIQANLEKEVEREKALAEAEGRIRENRQNEDVNRRAMQLRLEEERKKLVEAINTTFTNLGTGTLALLTDKERLGTAVAGLTVLALGVYSAREGTRVAGQVFSRYAAIFPAVRLYSSETFWLRCTVRPVLKGLRTK